jgi:hypothetical protein
MIAGHPGLGRDGALRVRRNSRALSRRREFPTVVRTNHATVLEIAEREFHSPVNAEFPQDGYFALMPPHEQVFT